MANKISASNAARKLALAAIASAALNEGNARNALIALVKQAGARVVDKGDSPALKAAAEYQRSIRDEYIVGRIAARIPGNDDAGRIEKARAMLALPNAKSDKPDRRTEEQERLYGAARVAWSTLLKDAGIARQDSRDTSKTRAPKASKANAKAPPMTPGKLAAPKVKDASEVRAFLQQQGAMMLAFINKNAGVVDLATSEAVNAFRAAVNGTDE